MRLDVVIKGILTPIDGQQAICSRSFRCFAVHFDNHTGWECRRMLVISQVTAQQLRRCVHSRTDFLDRDLSRGGEILRTPSNRCLL